nr:anaerobic ribonucleoside-triphosphate reductase [Candidatus Njordarchaeum guaymaensis]
MEKEGLIASVLSALSSQIRVGVLRLLSRKGTASFTEIMQSLGLNIRTEAGKFAYHLRELTNAELVVGSSYKGYSLTSLGERVIDFVYLLEETALKRSKEMYVRTSRYSIETFDRKKIARSLINEAGAPEEIAENIAKEVEERLLKMKVKYLTAPLIREFVNAILIEKGMEDYRHTLTRLGLPVYDVTELIEKQQTVSYKSPELIHSKSGDAVLEQYMLLKALPRRVSDAHLSGSIHIPNANYWVLRPNSIQHDLRLILSGSKHQTSLFSPHISGEAKDAESAVSRIIQHLRLSDSNISGNQSLDHLNVILSPYFDKLHSDETTRLAKRLITGLGSASDFAFDPSRSTSIILELHTPKFLKETPAVASSGQVKGSYEEYEDNARDLLLAMIDILIKGGESSFPYLMPNLFFRVCPDCISEKETMLKIHELSALWGTPFFINEKPDWQTESVNYDGNLVRLDSKWMGDSDLGTLRTGNLDWVCVNLPRIAYESKGDDSLLFERLDEILGICKDALEVKGKVIEDRMFKDNVLAMLSYACDGEPYYRITNSTRAIGYMGLPESAKFHTGALASEWKEINKLSLRILKHMRSYADALTKNTRQRWVITQAPSDYYSARLAKLDVERFGRDAVGLDIAEEPYYSTDNTLKGSSMPSLREVSIAEAEFHSLLNGGHIFIMPLPDTKVSPESVFEITSDIIKGVQVGLYAFARQFTHCLNCQTSRIGILQKCTSCGSSSTQLLSFGRMNGPQRMVESLLSGAKNRPLHHWAIKIP